MDLQADIRDFRRLIGSQTLGQLARVLSVWRRRGWEAVSGSSLVHWVRASAAYGVQPPDPLPAIRLATAVGWFNWDGDERVSASETLRTCTEDASVIDRFPPSLAFDLFGRLQSAPELAPDFTAVLGMMRRRGGRLGVSWVEVPDDLRRVPLWLWLQQLGLGRHNGDFFDLTQELTPFVEEARGPACPLSEAELLAQLEAQRVRAAMAEELVVAHEKRRLEAAGAVDLAAGVRRVSITDVGAGYDVASYSTDGSPRFIEVKSSAGTRACFHISSNELACARRGRDAYWLAWVSWASRLPNGPSPIAWFRNPASVLDAGASPWEVRHSEALVVRVDDDRAYQVDN